MSSDSSVLTSPASSVLSGMISKDNTMEQIVSKHKETSQLDTMRILDEDDNESEQEHEDLNLAGNANSTINEDDEKANEDTLTKGTSRSFRNGASSKMSYGNSGDLSDLSCTGTPSEATKTGSSGSSLAVKIDGHGRLVVQMRRMSDTRESRESIKTYNERLMKWTSMMRHWENYLTIDHSTGIVTSVSDKFRSRIQKGIPDAVRAFVYMKLLDVEVLKKGKENLYEELAQKKKIGTGTWDEIIRRDLHRTNPDHIMFMNKEGAGQEALFRVLRAYSLYDDEIGYCQGMGFFVSVMLTYVPEDDAFWLLVGLLKKHGLRELYLPNLIGMRRSFFVFQKLLQNSMPKLSKHLDKYDFSAPIYASRWYGTLCADFSIEATLRIWDILVCDGPKILYQVGLAIMKRCKKELKQGGMEDFLGILREAQRSIEPDDLISDALKISVKQKDIEVYGKKFDEIELKLGSS